MSALPLFTSYKQRGLAFIVLTLIFVFNLAIEYHRYKKITVEEVYRTDAVIKNIYHKDSYDILKLQTDHFTFFTSTPQKNTYTKLQKINIFLITQKLTFFEYLKNFYTYSFHIKTYPHQNSIKSSLYHFIDSQHLNKDIASLYNALFLAVNSDQKIRDLTAQYGISHLIAISGFHLGILSLVLYFLLHFIYQPIHQKYFPYRNKRFDLLCAVALILLGYLVFLDFVPSLLRSFAMLVMALFMLRNNIKILSFETLFWVVLIILSLFPKLLFSLSLWFSVAGVFYIFLFLHYFKDLHKYFQFILFNLWIYLAMNPIVHYFFSTTSYEQLLSPILTVLFTLFYPITLLLHLVDAGGLFDPALQYILNLQVDSFEKVTIAPIFIGYIILSVFSIYSKRAFVFLNLSIIGFSFYLFI